MTQNKWFSHVLYIEIMLEEERKRFGCGGDAVSSRMVLLTLKVTVLFVCGNSKNLSICVFAFVFQIRPCEMYNEEYNDCTSIKARFHQYFIYGETIDCSQWKRDFNSCVRWRDEQNSNALVKLN